MMVFIPVKIPLTGPNSKMNLRMKRTKALVELAKSWLPFQSTEHYLVLHNHYVPGGV